MLPLHCHHRVRIDGPADLAAARGVCAALLARGDLDAEAAGRLHLIVAELGSNLIRHAGGGTLLLRCTVPPVSPGSGPGAAAGGCGIECLSLDRGPGIADLDGALADRHDPEPGPGRSLGYGLGAVRRLADRFAIQSRPGEGTVVLARVRDRGQPPPPADPGAFEHGAVMLPMAGCDDCGDGWMVRQDGLALLVDGLGHGEPAGVVARRAETVFAALPPGCDPQAALADLHAALRGTRGAAATVVRLRPDAVDYAAVGNITAALVTRTGSAALNSRWGVIGYNAAPPPTASLPWGPGDHVVLHSDGCSGLVPLFAGSPLRHVDSVLAAAILLRDGIGRIDDQSVLVLANRRAVRDGDRGQQGWQEGGGP
ncbi:ATP-binding protein [Rhodospirillum centenum]|uniref:ATP-binding protein n=1 Tax=Rhodospirillum centenum TaxID=34018 RepID=UPI0002F0E5BC|nr:ATP-binding protein [Rhodospirillum centenum]